MNTAARLLLLLAFGLPLAAGAADFAAWTHRQTIRVEQPGLTRLELEPALLDASRATGDLPFHDLRVVSPAGIETPYILIRPSRTSASREQAIGFKVTLNAGNTVIEFRSPKPGAASAVSLQTNANSFIKPANLEASSDGINWQQLATGELICRQQGTERLRIDFEIASWTHFRVTVDDQRQLPIAFTGAEVSYEAPQSRTVPHPVTIRSRREDGQATRLVLDLGTANVWLGSLRVRTPEPVFQRQASVLDAQATLFRLQHEGRSAEELEIPVHQRAATREIELIIPNGDSPPLRIEGIEATRHPVPVLFQADAAGEWQLFIGNPQAPQPRYDITGFSDKISIATAAAATASAVEPNSAFRKTATAPEVGDTGTKLDISPWPLRRSVVFQEAGIVELELDANVLAQAESDLHDLRVIRDGSQVPFVVTRPGTFNEIEATFAEVRDDKHPTRSKWDIRLPVRAMPVAALLLDSSTPLFDRSLSIGEYHDTDQGRIRRHLGSANWQRTPGASPRHLEFRLHTPPTTDAMELFTENGDNPRLQITSMRLRYPVVRLLFRVPDTAPVHLYYGNRRATFARYDVDLVRSQFENASKVAATLGDEEKLGAFKAERTAISGKGSPWLWAALALVVAGLLWVVAKMLSKASL